MAEERQSDGGEVGEQVAATQQRVDEVETGVEGGLWERKWEVGRGRRRASGGRCEAAAYRRRSAGEEARESTWVWLMTAKSDCRGEAVCAPKSSSRWEIAR